MIVKVLTLVKVLLIRLRCCQNLVSVQFNRRKGAGNDK